MDDLAPAPTQRTSDDGGRRETFMARKKAVKKVQVAPAPKPETEPELTPEAEAEPEADHQLDLLA